MEKKLESCRSHRVQFHIKSFLSDVISKIYDFLKVESYDATPGDAIRPYCHVNVSGMTSFFTSKTPSNVEDLAVL